MYRQFVSANAPYSNTAGCGRLPSFICSLSHYYGGTTPTPYQTCYLKAYRRAGQGVVITGPGVDWTSGYVSPSASANSTSANSTSANSTSADGGWR